MTRVLETEAARRLSSMRALLVQRRALALLPLLLLALGTTTVAVPSRASDKESERGLIQPTRPSPRGDGSGEHAPIPPSRKPPSAKKHHVRPSQAERAVLDPWLRAHPEVARNLAENPTLVRDAKYLEKHPELAQFIERYPKMGERIQRDPYPFMQPKKKTGDQKP